MIICYYRELRNLRNYTHVMVAASLLVGMILSLVADQYTYNTVSIIVSCTTNFLITHKLIVYNMHTCRYITR